MKGNKKVGVKAKASGLCWVVLSVASFAAGANDPRLNDLRLPDAAQQGDKEAVRSLLKLKTDVNARQGDGATALAWAAYRDDLETAELLIGAGANVNAANEYGVTPLTLACTNGSAAMAEKLMKNGADLKAAPWTGETALMRCARTGNIDAVKLLLSHGADVNSKENQQGQTALMWSVAAKHPDVARVLIEHGADIHARSKGGLTPLLFAAQQGDLISVQILLGAGANVNEATPEGDTALLVASASGHEALSIFLLDKGADPNAAGVEGITAMHYAVMKGLALLSGVRLKSFEPHLTRPNMPELVKALLAHGANPNVRLKAKKALSDRLFRFTQRPPGTGSTVGATPFLLAALTYDVPLMRTLAAGGANPRLATEENVTPMMVAAGLSCVRSAGVAFTEDEKRDSLAAVKLTFELGVDINAASNVGLTALHGAAYNGSDNIIQFLAENGANLNAKDQVGQTPLHKAANIQPPPGTTDRSLVPMFEFKSSVDLLVKLGATPLNATVAQGSDLKPVAATQ